MDPTEEQPLPRPKRADRALLTRTSGHIEATMICNLMQSYGIPCEVVTPVSARLWPTLTASDVVVEKERLAEAKQLLADHLRMGMEAIPGGRSEGPEQTGGREQTDTGAADSDADVKESESES